MKMLGALLVGEVAVVVHRHEVTGGDRAGDDQRGGHRDLQRGDLVTDVDVGPLQRGGAGLAVVVICLPSGYVLPRRASCCGGRAERELVVLGPQEVAGQGIGDVDSDAAVDLLGGGGDTGAGLGGPELGDGGRPVGGPSLRRSARPRARWSTGWPRRR